MADATTLWLLSAGSLTGLVIGPVVIFWVARRGTARKEPKIRFIFQAIIGSMRRDPLSWEFTPGFDGDGLRHPKTGTQLTLKDSHAYVCSPSRVSATTEEIRQLIEAVGQLLDAQLKASEPKTALPDGGIAPFVTQGGGQTDGLPPWQFAAESLIKQVEAAVKQERSVATPVAVDPEEEAAAMLQEQKEAGLHAFVTGMQEGKPCTCGYCGAVGYDHKVMKEHVKACPKNPILETVLTLRQDNTSLKDEIERLLRGDFTPEEFQNFCHNMSEENVEKFSAGCEAYQVKLLGRCPMREEIESLHAALRVANNAINGASPLPRVDAVAIPSQIGDIVAERQRQDAQWGGPEHDDKNTPNDWRGFIAEQLKKQSHSFVNPNPNFTEYRERMIKVSALALAAVESYDRLLKKTPKEESAP